MSKKYTEMFRDPKISSHIAKEISQNIIKPIRIMEVCGTHTVSIFRSGIRSLLPKNIELCSGPGCPVCVTSQREIDIFIMFAKNKDVIITTFGDLLKVPGTHSTLQREKAKGADVRIVYSTFDAIDIAKENPNKKIVFLGIGFETTSPTIAAAIIFAKRTKIKNFYIVSANKLVIPALKTLVNNNNVKIDGFLLPGHVSVIIGLEAYKTFVNEYQIPCVIAGFEPVDLLKSILMLVKQIKFKIPKLENAYERVVTDKGNLRAISLIREVFEIVDTDWRGIGPIMNSGLAFKEAYFEFDAMQAFDIQYDKDSYEPRGCMCGEILMGIKIPPQCNLYKDICTPMTPVGPCMVSTEGTCASYYRYHNDIFSYYKK